jgi:hypothetical protein
MLANRKNNSRLTPGPARGDVNLVVAGSVVCDPLDPRLGQGRDDFRIEDADKIGGVVVSVHADDPGVFPSRLELLQEISPVGRVHSLKTKTKFSLRHSTRDNQTDDDFRQTSEHLVGLGIGPHKVTTYQNLGHRGRSAKSTIRAKESVTQAKLPVQFYREKILGYGESNPELPRSKSCDLRGGNVSRYTISDFRLLWYSIVIILSLSLFDTSPTIDLSPELDTD